jgi:WXG100 family type VII secretion target
MPDHLRVHAETVYNTSHSVSNDAVELREELCQLGREWDSLSHGWIGKAASAYDALWQEWHVGAVTLVDVLDESSRKLGRAAAAYDEHDALSADVLTSTVDLGL